MPSEQRKEKHKVTEKRWTEVKKGAHVHPRTRWGSWRESRRATKSIAKDQGKRYGQASGQQARQEGGGRLMKQMWA